MNLGAQDRQAAGPPDPLVCDGRHARNDALLLIVDPVRRARPMGDSNAIPASR